VRRSRYSMRISVWLPARIWLRATCRAGEKTTGSSSGGASGKVAPAGVGSLSGFEGEIEDACGPEEACLGIGGVELG
jgi:hypothetical protein